MTALSWRGIKDNGTFTVVWKEMSHNNMDVFIGSFKKNMDGRI